MGKRELVALLNLSSWCLVMVERLFLAVPWGCLWFVIVVVSDHTHLLFLKTYLLMRWKGQMLWLFVQPTRVYLLDFFCSGIKFYLLLSPYFCFISLLYVDLYVLGDDVLIS